MEKLKIIALLGKAHSGKDTVGKMLCEYGGGTTMAFADRLKQLCAEIFGLQLEDFYTQEGKDKATSFPCLMCPSCSSVHVDAVEMADTVPLASCKLCGSTGDRKVFAKNWTHRTILQYVGTEGFRKIDPNVWVRYALGQAGQLLLKPGMQEKTAPFVVLTDCRFKSEATAIWAAGGEVWRIKRPETDSEAQGLKGHASEVEQESIKDSECQAVIQNDGTLDNLRGLVVSQFHRFLAKY